MPFVQMPAGTICYEAKGNTKGGMIRERVLQNLERSLGEGRENGPTSRAYCKQAQTEYTGPHGLVSS